MNNYTFRLKPNDDMFDAIEAFVRKRQIEAGCVLGAVGSLTRVVLRLANREYHSEFIVCFEIVSITGTVSIHGSHMHMSVADIVLAVFNALVYKRELCENDSGYEELVVNRCP